MTSLSQRKNAATADLSSLIQNFDQAGQRIENSASVMLSTYAYKVQDAAKRKAPVKTGKLRDSISVTKTGDTEYTIGPKVPYGLFQEFGTGTRGEFHGRAYTIRPKSGSGRLVFQHNGKWVSKSQVIHPGIKPHSFMRPGLEEVLGPLVGELTRKGALAITRGQP